MKYNIIDKRDLAGTGREVYTFEEVKNFFKPDQEELPEYFEKWQEITNLDELNDYLDWEADGMEVNYEVVEHVQENVYIDFGNLEVCDYDNGIDYVIESENGSGLYTVRNEDSGEVSYLTRQEVKKLATDIQAIDDTLEMIRNKDAKRVYTEDGLNYIEKSEFENLVEKYGADGTEDFYKVEYIDR